MLHRKGYIGFVAAVVLILAMIGMIANTASACRKPTPPPPPPTPTPTPDPVPDPPAPPQPPAPPNNPGPTCWSVDTRINLERAGQVTDRDTLAIVLANPDFSPVEIGRVWLYAGSNDSGPFTVSWCGEPAVRTRVVALIGDSYIDLPIVSPHDTWETGAPYCNAPGLCSWIAYTDGEGHAQEVAIP